MLNPYKAGFMLKCAEHGVTSPEVVHALYKKAGPSLKDKAAVGNKRAIQELKRLEEEKAYRAAHPNPLGSLVQQKAYIKQQGQKNLAKLTPEQRDKFWDDARRFQANVMRGRGLVGSFMPGLGMASAAGVLGASEAAASGVEGKSLGESLIHGALTGGTSYAGGKILGPIVGDAIGSVPRLIGKAKSLVSPASRAARAAQSGFKLPLAPVLTEQAAARAGNKEAVNGLQEFWRLVGDRDWSKLSRTERLAIKAKTGWDMTPRGVPVHFPKYSVGVAPTSEWTAGGQQFVGQDAENLLKAYPELRQVMVRESSMSRAGVTTDGAYNPFNKSIEFKKNRLLSPKSVGAHEVHHAIQDHDGMLPHYRFDRDAFNGTKERLRLFEDPSKEKFVVDSVGSPIKRDVMLNEFRHDVAAGRSPLDSFYAQDANEAGARAIERLSKDPGMWDTTLLEDLYDIPWSRLLNGNQSRITSKFSPTGMGRAVESDAFRSGALRSGEYLSRAYPFLFSKLSRGERQ